MAKSPKSSAATASAPLPTSYEAAMEELEGLIAQMEAGELSLEASLGAYQRGAVLVRYCQQVLAKVEQQVQVLESQQGEEVLVPYVADGAAE